MASFGSSFVPLTRERAISLFNEVLAGVRGIGGVHCCGALTGRSSWPPRRGS